MEAEPTYTLEEAHALVPQLRATLVALAVERRLADASHLELHRRLRVGAGGRRDPPADQDQLEADADEQRARVRGLLDHLESLGVVLRDLEAGLVDIPTRRNGRRAWLCWRLDDPELAYWHTTREGFGSRRPL